MDADKWFSAKPLAKRTFANFLKEICIAAGVKKTTQHCLRATSITYLNDSGFEARHIMFMSNHKNESSLRSYNRSVSSNQKKSLSSTLSSMASASRPDENKALMPNLGSSNVETPCQVSREVDLTSNVVNIANQNTANKSKHGIFLTILPLVTVLLISRSKKMADYGPDNDVVYYAYVNIC